MEKIKSFFEKIFSAIKKAAVVSARFIKDWAIDFVKTRSVGFYLLLVAIIACFVAPFVHKAGFSGTAYYVKENSIIPVVGMIICFILAVPKRTSKYSAVLTFATSTFSLLIFVYVSYMHLSQAMFGGVASTLGGILKQAGFHFSFCTIAYVGSMLLSVAAIFTPMLAKKKPATLDENVVEENKLTEDAVQ